MNWLVEPFRDYKIAVLSIIGGFAAFLVIWANVVMYQVNVPNSGVTFIEAQRLWTKGLVLCILYLAILLTSFYRWRLDTVKIASVLSSQLLWIKLIFANAIFLGLIAIPVIINMMGLFENPITVSKSFPAYYWICVSLGVLYFVYNPITSFLVKHAKQIGKIL